LKPPQEISNVKGNLVKFHIPGSGGCFLGVAQIEDGYTLQHNYQINGTGFVHYEQIHSNHIDWKTNEIKWHGNHIGTMLEGKEMGGGFMLDPAAVQARDEAIGWLDVLYSRKYPTVK
jgi:hypothetical protein